MTPLELKRFPLLAALGEDERAALVDELESVDVGPGTVLFEQGDPAEGLVLLVDGRVRVESNRIAAPAELGPGTALGAFSLAAGGAREARAETTSRSRLLVLRRDGYERLVAHAPVAACRLLEAVLADASALLREGLDEFAGISVDPSSGTD